MAADATESARSATSAQQQGLVPVPDPTALTATAVAQAKEDLRRELSSIQQLLSERILRIELVTKDMDTRLKGDLADNVNALEALLAQRITGLEGVLQLLDKTLTDVPHERDQLRERLQNDIKVAVDNLKHLHEERFNAIQQQFFERDTRSDQEKKASKEALDAALLAQKESVAQQNDANTTAATKSETSFTKQIDQIGTLIATLEKSLTDRITELKERIDRGEGQGVGLDRALGTPYDATVFQQVRDEAERAAERAAEQAREAREVSRAAQARAVMALVISAILVLITLASVIFAVVKK